MYIEERKRFALRRSVPKRAPSPLPPAPNQPLPKIPEQPKIEEINLPTSPPPKTDNTKDGDRPSSILSVANIPEASIDQAKGEKAELSSSSESEDHDDASQPETTLEQDVSQKVHEDLKAEIRRDLQASRSIFTDLLSPTVMSLIQSSFPQSGRPCKSGREKSKVVTSPVAPGYVPSIFSTVREGQEDAGASSGGGRSLLKCGAISDQIVYPSALRSNPITLSRGLKVVQSDSPTPKTTSSPIAPVDEVSVAEEIIQEQRPLEGSDVATAVVSGDTFGKEEYLETQEDQQEADDNDASSNLSLPPPRPQRPEVSIDLDFLMSVFQSQLIAREQSWLERSESELEQIAEEDPSKRDKSSTSTSENKDLINPPKTCLRTPPPTPQCPEKIPTPPNSSSTPAPLTPRTSSLPKDRTLIRKTPSPPSSSFADSQTTSSETDLQNRQLRLEQDVQYLMDVLTGHAHVQAQRSHLHQCYTDRCNHAHHHPRYYPMDGDEHVSAEEEENEPDHEASISTPLPRHIEELQHNAMHAPGYHKKKKKPQALITPSLLKLPTMAKGDKKEEQVRAEILEGSGPAIETNVLSTITTTTAHTTVIEVPTWSSSASSSSLTLPPPVPPLVSRSGKKKRPVPVPFPSVPQGSGSSTASTPGMPPSPSLNNNNNNKDDITLRRIAQLQHSHHETQVLHKQLDQFWDRLQTVESSQRAGLWQERYHELHERLLDMEFWKRSIGSGGGASGSSKHKDGKK